MLRARRGLWCRWVPRLVPATLFWSASAGSEFFPFSHSGAAPTVRAKRGPMTGSARTRNLEIPGLRQVAHPGMTVNHLFLQMPGKEGEAARPGDICARSVVARPLIAVEAVLRAGIDVDLDIGALGPDGLDIAERNPRVLFAEMKLRRHFRLVVGEANDGTAVIADRR